MIIDYLKYLKDISRKIILSCDFENVLLNKQKQLLCFQLDNLKESYGQGDENYEGIKKLYDSFFRTRDKDKQQFYGFGLICGTKYSAPILYVECSINTYNGGYIIELVWETLVLNYDIVVQILQDYHPTLHHRSTQDMAGNDDEYMDEDVQSEISMLDAIEESIQRTKDEIMCNSSFDRNIQLTLQLLYEVVCNLKSHQAFSPIFDCDESIQYNYEKEKELYRQKPKRNIEDNRERKSIFEMPLRYVETNHLFVNKIPHQLTTFKALDLLVKENEQNSFRNATLKKLLIKAISGSEEHNFNNSENSNIEEILQKYIPLQFSDTQIAAIKNAFNSNISYIQGPPGTGKSYTIGGIVLCALLLGKKVLLVSQKEPALNVIKEKIEPYLKEDFDGITYYQKDGKDQLVDQIKLIRSYSDNQNKLDNRLQTLSKEIIEYEKDLAKLNKDLDELEQHLAKNLDVEHRFLKKHKEFYYTREEFIKLIPAEYKLTKAYKFNYTASEKKDYSHILDQIKHLSYKPLTHVANLYRNKFKRHIKLKYAKDIDLMPDHLLWIYTKEFIKLHKLHCESEVINQNLSKDNDLTRDNIIQIKQEIKTIQLSYIKKKYKYNVISKLSERDPLVAQKNRDSLQNILRLLSSKNRSAIHNLMSQIEYHSITDLLPFWISDTRNIGEILPMQPELFDMVIVDESSQVNLAEVLPAFYRGKNICIVGDHKQLGLKSSGLNFTLNSRYDMLVWNKHFSENQISYLRGTDQKLTVSKCSILDFIRADNISSVVREEMLTEHFRSMPALASYTNDKFYNSSLKVMTETGDKIFQDCIKVIEVNGERDSKKTIFEEAAKIISMIEELCEPNNNINMWNEGINIPGFDTDFTIGIISLMTKQRDLIQELLEGSISQEKIEKHKIEVWTPHQAQGNERDVIFISMCLDMNSRMASSTYGDDRYLNVATSRAKKFTFIVHCQFREALYDKIRSYIGHGGYAHEQRNKWKFDENAYESEFEKRVYEELKKYIYSKNDKAIKIYNQVTTCGQKRLDFVLHNDVTHKTVAIEVDGQYHFRGRGLQYSKEHKNRMEILQRAGWKIINTPYFRWYDKGWLCDSDNPKFNKEIERIRIELDANLFD